ncbi:flagellar basal body rod protein FlgG [Bacillus coahuilensis m2-6]|uniref:flagellar hook-basal body protein n=1 Tax=Bacillus coahuilensis TaxID=408580 RepID=UPI0007500A5D|nr:flagellar hook-basal body protein [Bacillus coahuilensis]KUP05118.1 flagellar basal body rod protein FlgG [Bacillus coahuilensis m2-6]
MNRIMNVATNTMAQLQQHLDVISHNVANVDTNGYKAQNARFSEMLVQQFDNQKNPANEIGRLTPNGLRLGVGAGIGQIQMNTSQGALQSTGRSLDFILQNQTHYFKVLNQSGGQSEVNYSRSGAFYLSPLNDDTAMLTDANGNPILNSDDQPITIPGDATSFYPDQNGVLVVETPRGQERIELGVVSIQKPQFLESKGGNLVGLPTNFNQLDVDANTILTVLNGANRAEISVKQGFIEKSNVDLSKELTDMINVQRSYQFQARTISMADQMMGLVNGIR